MNATAVPANTRCPRCGRGFACGAAGPGPCACAMLTLSPALLAQLQQSFRGCLCLDCLTALGKAGVDDGEPAAGR